MIEVSKLFKSYGNKQVLYNVSFSAEDGLITGFVGPNGAGKSTTMRIIACLEQAELGTALVDGVPYSQTACPGRAMGVYLGQGYLPTHMTGRAYLSYVCRLAKMPNSKVDELLNMVELTDAADKKIGSYSLGMKQREGIAAAIAGSPTTLMLDEPVNGLDPMGVQWLRGILREQASSGKAVLLSSHLLAELELVADRVVMLNHGRVVARGNMADLEMAGGSYVLVRTSDNDAMRQLLSLSGIDAQSTNEGLVVSGLTTREVCRIAFEGNVLIDHLEEQKSSLEEVFMATAAGAEKEGVANV